VRNIAMSENYLHGLKTFIKMWDKNQFNVEIDLDMLRLSDKGNVNFAGNSICYESPTLTKSHPLFGKAIEVGVRKLTFSLVKKLNCITYSSCQGHFSSKESPIMRQRYVGIIPRNEQESQYFLKYLHDLANTVNNQVKQTLVRVVIDTRMLDSDEGSMSCINFCFVPLISEDEELYFRDVEIVYNQVLEVLNV
jgi:hypothetical protein